MKKARGMNFALAVIGLLAFALLGTSCSDEPGPALTMEFTGCDFSGATVARVEIREAGTLVAYGNGTLTGGAAAFPLHDVDTDAIWLPTTGVTYNARGYCFSGSVGDPLPASGYWQTNDISYTSHQASAYDEIGFIKSYFSYTMF